MEPEQVLSEQEVHVAPSSSRSKFLWAALGFLFVILVLGAFFWYTRQSKNVSNEASSQVVNTVLTPTPDALATWIAYTNDPSDSEVSVPVYSVRYPKDMFVRFICPGEELTLSKRTPQETNEAISMETCARDGSYDIEIRTVANTAERPKTDQYHTVTEETVMVNGVTAKKYTGTVIGQPDGPIVPWATSIYIPDGLQVHILHYEKKDYTDIVNTMLSTFTLLHRKSTHIVKASPTEIPLDKKYSDKDIGYTITYPSPWLFRRTYGNDIPKMAPTDILSGIDLHNNSTPTTNTSTIVVNVLDAHGETSIDSWITKYDLNYPKNGTKRTISFAGSTAIKYVYSNGNDRESEAIYFLSGSHAYRINYDEVGTISDLTRKVVNTFTP